MRLHLDWESRSTINLPKAGVYVYAKHATTDLWCGAWAFDDEEPEIWHPGLPVPPRIVDHINAGGVCVAHNAAFERIIWEYIATPRHGWPVARLEQFECTAAMAAAMALPRSLDPLAKALGLAEKKDEEGASLMMRMCRPRSYAADGTPIWWDVPERLERLYAYCLQDLRTERAAEKCLRPLEPRERELYLLDQRINDRGIAVDRPLVLAAQTIVNEGIDRANATLDALTDGIVPKVTSVGQMKEWLAAQGVAVESLDKAAVAALLEGELPPHVRSLLETRTEAGRTSLAKLHTMVGCACDDDRLRGLLLWHGASTGRWTGRLVQPQNFVRPTVADVEQYIPAVMRGAYDEIDLFASPLEVVSSLLRSMLTAKPGHELIAADFSAIECRVLNWLAGQNDVVANFYAYDAGDKSKDPYKRQAVGMGRAARVEDVTKDDRQAGKAAELGCGFQMGWSKFIDAAWDVYQVRVNEEQSKTAVRVYRETHPEVVEFWHAANAAAIAAVENPGQVQTFGGLRNLRFVKSGNYLYLILPSKRPLVYAAPKVVEAPVPWGGTRPGVEFSGVGFAHQWQRQRLYGGLIVENIVQAVSRDLLAEAMFRLEERGYPIVLGVHDELVAEVAAGFGSVEEFEAIMRESPTWAVGCPVSAEGWRGARYRK